MWRPLQSFMFMMARLSVAQVGGGGGYLGGAAHRTPDWAGMVRVRKDPSPLRSIAEQLGKRVVPSVLIENWRGLD